MADKNVYKPRPISGFPEWSPEVRRTEQRWIDTIRRVFESYGYGNLETPSVEELDVLLAKGETDKEIYTLQRLHEGDGDEGGEARLGLHYDLTVPFARYAAQHFGELVFPFKRYQIQRVWRGERPQEGRFREFYQCDVDVIDLNGVSLTFDAEMAEVAHAVLSTLGIGPFRLRLSNRKILQGYLAGLGVADVIPAIRLLDKLDKIGAEGVVEALQVQLGLAAETAQRCVALAEISSSDASFVEAVRVLGVENELIDEGLEELVFVIEALGHLPEGRVVADLSLARGFDYYTGTVYEGAFLDYSDFGSICSGGRYDDLAGSFINQHLPGVGISIGLTRIFSKLVAEERLDLSRFSPTDVLVVLPGEEVRAVAAGVAQTLRGRGFNVELYHEPTKIGKQLRYAARKEIPFVWFPPFKPGETVHEVKDMAAGVQAEADAETWTPGG